MIANFCSKNISVLLVFAYSSSLWRVSVSVSQEKCSVTVANGTVNGKIVHTLDPNKKVCAYYSIPYAAPPVGLLRFKAPEPAKAWGILNSTSLPNWCPQPTSPAPGKVVSEDCLYLNVYQPIMQQSPETGIPVMIWFHGGSFTSGSSLGYHPTKLLARGDVILVVVHYRLGVLGFLSTGDKACPGNFGLKDQAFSIRWVNENIAAFGGNPNKVTIFGESAGASSVMYQLISPLNKGLIHGIIAQSGAALSNWALAKNPLPTAQNIAKRVGCPTTDSENMVSCLTKIEWKKLLHEQINVGTERTQKFKSSIAFPPVVEPNLPGAFITTEPEKMMRTGSIPDIPVMIGATKHDGSMFLALMHTSMFGPFKLDQNPKYLRERIVPDLLKYCHVFEDESNGATAATVEMTYLSGKNRSSWNDIMPGLVDMMSVYYFKSSIEKSAEILSGRNNKVYLYSLEHHSNNSIWSMMFGSHVPVNHGVAHGDDLMYLFDLPAKFSADDLTFSNLMCDMWLNFAQHGNPTPTSSDRYDDWKPYDAVDESYMKLNITPKLLHGYRNSWLPNSFEWN